MVRVEDFTPRDIYVRDGWICQLCGDPIDRRLLWPDPLSKSIDHRVALKNGGDHSLANCWAAHLVCNLRKGIKEIGYLADDAATSEAVLEAASSSLN